MEKKKSCTQKLLSRMILGRGDRSMRDSSAAPPTHVPIIEEPRLLNRPEALSVMQRAPSLELSSMSNPAPQRWEALFSHPPFHPPRSYILSKKVASNQTLIATPHRVTEMTEMTKMTKMTIPTHLSNISSPCRSGGARQWQSSDKGNLSRSTSQEAPDLIIKVEQVDCHRLQEFLARRLNNALHNSTKMYLVSCDRSSERQVEVLVQIRFLKDGEKIPVVRVCEQNKLKIFYYFTDQANMDDIGKPFPAYLMNATGDSIFGVVLALKNC